MSATDIEGMNRFFSIGFGVEAMLKAHPEHWWRYVNCARCAARRQQGCVRRHSAAPAAPHQVRVEAGVEMWRTLRSLIEDQDSVLGGPPMDSPLPRKVDSSE